MDEKSLQVINSRVLGLEARKLVTERDQCRAQPSDVKDGLEMPFVFSTAPHKADTNHYRSTRRVYLDSKFADGRGATK